ncbi:MAG: hypothetical protein HYZ07_02685 [Candidatus Harrisonbacteria bacterium]|nr:hypothetical protein [Candidatus Harrisonbacteria bacterium]
MKEKLDRIFNPVALLLLNIAIVAATELTGTYFFDTGIIHVIAGGFIVLAVLRAFLHYYSYDAVLENFFHAALVASIVFAASHVAEFYSYRVLRLSEDATFANVANFYIVSLLVIAMGAEIFLTIRRRRRPVLIASYVLAAAIGTGFIIALFVNDKLVSLEPDSPAPYLYAIVSFIVGAVAYVRSEEIGRVVGISRHFVDYLLAGIVLIILSVLPNVFYELLEDAGLPTHQIIYASHFLFYAALSLMFLAFRTISGLGGVYADVKALASQNIIPPLP